MYFTFPIPCGRNSATGSVCAANRDPDDGLVRSRRSRSQMKGNSPPIAIYSGRRAERAIEEMAFAGRSGDAK